MSPAERRLAAVRPSSPQRARRANGDPGPRRRRLRRHIVPLVAAASLVAGLATIAAPAGADPVGTLQQQANAISAEINATNLRIQVLDEIYLQAQTKLTILAGQVRTESRAISAAKSALSGDESHLRAVAIEAYVTGGDAGNLAMVMSGSQQTAPEQQVYLQAAAGNLNGSVATVRNAERQLQVRSAALGRSEAAARSNEQAIAGFRAKAEALTNALNVTLAQVKGQLAQAVAAAQAAQAAAARQAAAAAAARLAAQLRNQQSPGGSGSPPTTTPSAPPPANPPPVGSGAAAAVAAAQSQQGVPYIYGGATPGVGFDCSGLTMWAWGQAGVSLTHGATEQYYQIPHVSLSDLQPGDLVFYGNASILYHVVMYIGGGMVVQAEQPGTNVMDTPLWSGAYGAGRP